MSDDQVYSGAKLRFVTLLPFASFDKIPVTPDVVFLYYLAPGQPLKTLTWTNPTGDPTGTIVKTGTGLFQAEVDTTGLPGMWEFEWSCKPSSGIDTTATQTAWKGVKRVLPSLSDAS